MSFNTICPDSTYEKPRRRTPQDSNLYTGLHLNHFSHQQQQQQQHQQQQQQQQLPQPQQQQQQQPQPQQQQQQDEQQQQQSYANVHLSTENQPRIVPQDRNEFHHYGNVGPTGNTYEALRPRQVSDGSTYTGLMTSSHQQSTQKTVDEGETFGFVCVAFFVIVSYLCAREQEKT